MVVWPLTEALPVWGALCVASTAQGSCVLGILGERRRLLRGGDKTG